MGHKPFDNATTLARRLGELGAEKVILFGSLADSSRRVGPDSDVDMVVIMPGVENQRFHKRLGSLPEVVDFPHPIDLFVYSPNEWERISARSFIQYEVLSKGMALFERGG